MKDVKSTIYPISYAWLANKTTPSLAVYLMGSIAVKNIDSGTYISH